MHPPVPDHDPFSLGSITERPIGKPHMECAIESGSRTVSLRKQRMLITGAILFFVSVPLALLAWRTLEDGRHTPARILFRRTQTHDRRSSTWVMPPAHVAMPRLPRLFAGIRWAAPFFRSPSSRCLPASAADGRPLFESQGLEYSIEKRDGRVWHQETRRDASGKIVARSEAEVQFVLGSGRQGISYLIGRDGFLFESPINWYSQKRRWDLSPGFEVANYHFDRPIRPGCLYCHANRAQSVPTSINQYRQPIFEGHAIGCERCHGPGELHASDPAVNAGRDPTIVNPADLEPSLRDAVCEQCHLIGDHRVVRAGRREEDFRPGLPFERFWTVFVQPAGQDENRFVGQVEQMHKSQCFLASKGRLGCISCHDPHELPAPEEKCGLLPESLPGMPWRPWVQPSGEAPPERSPKDDCAGCHMPREKDSDIPHSASANHRIPRFGSAAKFHPRARRSRRPAASSGARFRSTEGSLTPRSNTDARARPGRGPLP